MNIRPTLIVIVAVLAVSCVRHRLTPRADQSKSASPDISLASLKPKLGYVPDETTAIAIAKAVWVPVFGKDGVEAQKPITASLQNGVWVVQGRNPVPFPSETFVALISQDDGRILEVRAYND
jgi:hypothetical protein